MAWTEITRQQYRRTDGDAGAERRVNLNRNFFERI
jgi:hypothetical protein